MNKIKEEKEGDYQTLLISMDIKWAFHNIRWPVLEKNLKQTPYSTYLINFIISFLEDR